MTLWFVFALMTVAAIFAVLWPLSRNDFGVTDVPSVRTSGLRMPAVLTSYPVVVRVIQAIDPRSVRTSDVPLARSESSRSATRPRRSVTWIV